MNILFLDGSPKTQNSASGHFLEGLHEILGSGHTITQHNARKDDPAEVAHQLMTTDALVIAFPLYVDGIPSHLLFFLEALQRQLSGKESKAMVYTLCNNGFYEARQTALALQMVKVWCEKSGLLWGKGIGIGAGGMALAAPVGRGPFAGLGKEFQALAKLITQRESAQDSFSQPNFPRFLYKTMAHVGWRRMARQNGVSGKAMGRQRFYQLSSD